MDGQYLPMSEAKISVLDWGFLHSDATYDTVHVWNGRFFRLDLHLDRFLGGMERLRMKLPYDRDQIAAILENCVALSGHKASYVEMICTRGSSPTFSRDPRQSENRFIAFAVPYGSVANEEQLRRGLHVAISDPYLRTLLIHGARSVMCHAKVPTPWQKAIQERRPANVAAVALANKMARIAWAILAHGSTYEKNYVSVRTV